MQYPETRHLVRSRIEGITTHWSVVKDSSHFTLRYAPAIRKYIASMATNSSDVEDILQDFLFRVVKKGFHRQQVDAGKFRYYLKAAVRNAVRDHYRSRQGSKDSAEIAVLADLPVQETGSLDDLWTNQWRDCLLERTWLALERIESDTNRQPYTVLKLAAAFPDETSAQLAARAAARSGNQISPEAYRQQLHRARKRFAELLIDEVAATLEQPTSADIESELIDLGLIQYLRGALRAT